MFPKTWPRVAKRRSSDSLRSLSSVYSFSSLSPSHSADDSVTTTTDGTVFHADDFLDEHLPIEYFRQDVIRLIHKLRIPGWSLVTIDMAMDLGMSRISSALTNSVFCVKPPQYIKEAVKREYAGRPYYHKLPPVLLLRIYGPQICILIDREKELETVAELTRHNIGPRLMGTFKNGRFEQFLNANALTKEELRNPETSIQIAKRMRDLHLNVPLKPEDVAIKYSVWKNFWNWAPAARDKMLGLERSKPGTMQRVMHTSSFDEFLVAVRTYQKYLEGKYLNEVPVFSHNDTQYGNLLRLEPPKGSPLLRPQYEHRQLVVIDFEFSGPNLNMYDIANHFCEWMGDYHHPTMPHHIWKDRYPTPEEQRRFVSSYVEHGASVLDDAIIEPEVDKLLEGARDWKPAVSAFWALWGIIQTPTEADLQSRHDELSQNPQYEVLSKSPTEYVEVEEDGDDGFDYLSYTSEKLALFWEDTRALGIDGIEAAK